MNSRKHFVDIKIMGAAILDYKCMTNSDVNQFGLKSISNRTQDFLAKEQIEMCRTIIDNYSNN